MKPYIICHVAASIDGRIDCDMTEKMGSDAYYPILDTLNCPTTIEGRVTCAMHSALGGEYVPADLTPVGHECYYKATESDGYNCAIDTYGKLTWGNNEINGKPLLCILSEKVTKEYVDNLTKQGISWIATGKEKIDLRRSVEILNEHFGVERIAVVGGGHINGAFLEAGLLDEISILFGSAVDGREGLVSAFDGISNTGDSFDPYHLKLESVERCEQDAVWIRYKTF